MTRVLGVDLGRRRIGIAVGDTVTGAVRPLAMVRRIDDERDARTIERMLDEQRATELVVGLPCNMDGSEGPQALETRAWADAMARALAIPVALRDERLTSAGAESRLGRMRRGRSGGPPSGAARDAYRSAVDRQAAAAIVQAELDARGLPSAAPASVVTP